jgi:L-ascorbate metabolism protein UlaG (beta-lactamase superfamily)
MILIVILVVLVLFFGTVVFFGYVFSGPRYKGPVTDHFNGKEFLNPGNRKAKGMMEALRWMVTRERGAWTAITDAKKNVKPAERITQGIRLTFINHSTFLIQFNGLNILTDPIWSKRTSPVEWAGPKRMRPPGLSLEDLPKIDVLLLSHNHWDHLDINTVVKIYQQHHPKIVTPLGVKAFLERRGIEQITDLDWWKELKIADSVGIRSVPAQHFSGRGMFDRDATLWCGYVIVRPEGNIYFVGDTGYNPETFKEIGERCSPIELALVPIGAFKPASFMGPIHCSPAEAVMIHQESKAKQSVATHFGTFGLADDGQTEPIIELEKALSASGINPAEFIVMTEGIPADFK